MRAQRSASDRSSSSQPLATHSLGDRTSPGRVRPVRLVDVALAAGVSQGTASNVFNKPDQVSEETRAKVMEAAAALGYRGPDPVGRLLRAGRTNTIGVLISNPLSHFFRDPVARSFMSGIASVCDEQRIGITLISAVDEDRAAQTIRSALVDGFIIHCLEDDTHLVELAQTRNLPITVVDAHMLPNVPHITVDDRKGARLAMEHALALGHRRIGVLTLNLKGDVQTGFADDDRLADITYEVSRKRMEGYHAALADIGVPLDASLVYECVNNRAFGARGAAALLAQDDPPTAILTMSDVLAMGVLDHARQIGMSVPGDLSVIGYDDMPDAPLADPPLTTINQPSIQKGELAARAVLGGDGGPASQELPVQLVVRNSTAAPRT